MRVTTNRTLAAALLVLGAAAAFAEPVRLKYNCSKGDQSKYKMTMLGTTELFMGDRIQETVLTTEMFLTQRVEDVADTGVITMGTSIDSGKVVVNGMPNPLPYTGQKVQTQMLRNGEIVSAGAGPNFNNSQLIFPDRPLNVGSTWEATLPPNDQVPVPLKVRYTYDGRDTFKAADGKLVPCVKIRSQVSTDPAAPASEGMKLTVKADGTILFDDAKGRMLNNTVESNMEMVMKRTVGEVTHSLITRMKMTIILEIQY